MGSNGLVQQQLFQVGDTRGSRRIIEYKGYYRCVKGYGSETKTQHHYLAKCIKCNHVKTLTQNQLKKIKQVTVCCGNCCGKPKASNSRSALHTMRTCCTRPDDAEALWFLWCTSLFTVRPQDERKPFDSERQFHCRKETK